MGQKINPTGFRSRHRQWRRLAEPLVRLRKHEFSVTSWSRTSRSWKFIKGKYEATPGFPGSKIERTRDAVTVLLFTRPAGRDHRPQGGRGREAPRRKLQTLTGRRIEIKIQEVTRPEIEAQLISEDIAEAAPEAASSFRRTMKRARLRADHGRRRRRGVKIQLSGRLGGLQEMSRDRGGEPWVDPPEHPPGQDRLRVLRRPRRRRKATSASRCGSTKAITWKVEGTTDASDAQAGQVPKKKSQKGRVRGNATRGNYVAFTASSASRRSSPARSVLRPSKRAGSAGQPVRQGRRQALHSHLPAQVYHFDPGRNPNG